MGQLAGITHPKVGQHARISTAEKRKHPNLGVGQHAGMMGQHKQEWWVNMRRNSQYRKKRT